MKLHTIQILASLVLASSTFAASFDTEGFGSRLNGWQKNKTANYSFTDAKYRTHVPTITYSPSGMMFLSTQVELLAAAGKGAICQIGLTFSPSGVLDGAQIKGSVGNKALDTGLIRRPEAPAAVVAPADGSSAVSAPRPFNGTDEMVVELFTRFDTEMKKVTEAKETLRSDLFSRIAGNPVKSADLSAGLRHNVNLMLQHVNR
jgi:hypothetical protein